MHVIIHSNTGNTLKHR